MTWRDHLALLLGAASPLALAGNTALASEPAMIDEGQQADPPTIQKDLLVFRDPAERQRLLLFAGHRSHSSHSSHRSHSSHYSSSGGGGHSSHSSHYSSSGGTVTPAPLYSPPPAPKPAPTPAPSKTPSPSATAPQDLSGTTPAPRLKADELETMVTKVQVALIVRGYDPGPVNGVFGSQTKAALAKFQLDHHLPSTGFMDLPSLRLLDVVR